jgi:hypothetical protein
LVYRTIWQSKATNFDVVLGQLIVAALFHGMRSCECSNVTGERKTKILIVANIRFFHKRREIHKTKETLHLLQFSTSVTITFVRQKTNQHYAMISQHASGKDICPVKTWALIITRILSDEDCTVQSQVNVYRDTAGTLCTVHATEVAQHLKNTVSSIGANVLGFTANDVGTHSNRTSFAMMVYLQRVHPFTIMLQGRWSSEAFLLYVRSQVQQFSTGLSNSMVQEDFFTITEVDRFDLCETSEDSSRTNMVSYGNSARRR